MRLAVAVVVVVMVVDVLLLVVVVASGVSRQAYVQESVVGWLRRCQLRVLQAVAEGPRQRPPVLRPPTPMGTVSGDQGHDPSKNMQKVLKPALSLKVVVLVLVLVVFALWVFVMSMSPPSMHGSMVEK